MPSIVNDLQEKGLRPALSLSGVQHGLNVYCLASTKNTQAFIDVIYNRLGSNSNTSLKVIGLDTETDTRRNKTPMAGYPSTIQISFGHGLVGIFQVYTICITRKQEFPQTLKHLLANRNIVKVGVGLSQDASGLRSALDVEVFCS